MIRFDLEMEREERKRYRGFVRFFEKKSMGRSPNEMAIEIGKFFLGTPYPKTKITHKGKERLIVNLREQDCVTFVENILALLWSMKSEDKSFDRFKKILRMIRYRGGRIQGYPSRLHYVSEWIRDNEKKGILREVTKEIGGKALRKSLHYMTRHISDCPPLRDPKIFKKMKAIERKISQRPFFFIPKRNLSCVENRIHEGDIIAIVSQREGLDIQHIGFAIRFKRRIHLLHASQKEGRVAISKGTLVRDLDGNKESLGIRVVRIKG